MHPYTIVEEEEFRNLIQEINTDVCLLRADSLHDKCQNLYLIHKDLLKKKLLETSSMLSFTCDVWSSKNHKAFFGITVHYIDKDWNLKCYLLDFIELLEAHTGTCLLNAFKTTLDELDLSRKVSIYFKIYSVQSLKTGSIFSLNNFFFNFEGFSSRY